MSTFQTKKPLYFLKKSQSLPNEVIFDNTLSDSGKVLVVALNSLPESWTVRQDHIANLLNFGREKMQSAIKSACESGYLQVSQKRKESGVFAARSFRFAIDKDFNCECFEDQEVDFKIISPMTGYPVPVQSVTADPPTTCIYSREEAYIEETTTSSLGEPEASHEDESVVVVSSSLDSSCRAEQSAKEKLLGGLDLPDHSRAIIMKYSITQISGAISAMQQYAKSHEIASEAAYLIQALKNGWTATYTQEDHDKRQREDALTKVEENRHIAKHLIEFSSIYFTESRKISLSEYSVKILVDGKFYEMSLAEEHIIDTLKNAINKYFSS